MKVSISEARGVTILDLQGRLTIGGGEIVLRNAVREALDRGETKLLLNMAGVTDIDSSGIGDVVTAHAAFSNRGGQLKLLKLPPKVHDLLAITHLITVIEVFSDEADAVDSFR